MADPATAGGLEAQGAGATSTAPIGGDQTHGEPAPTTQAKPDVDISDKLNSTWKDAYAKGLQKGAERREQERLTALGVASFDELQEIIEFARVQRTAEGQQSQQAQQDAKEAEARVRRQLQEERKALQEKLESYQAKISRYETQSTVALHMDIKGRLLSQGVIPEAADDAARDVVSRLQWAEDGRAIEVIDRLPDGTTQPARETLDEYLQSFKQSKGWYFQPVRAAGSGGAGDRSQAPRPQGASSGGGNFRDRLNQWRSRTPS